MKTQTRPSRTRTPRQGCEAQTCSECRQWLNELATTTRKVPHRAAVLTQLLDQMSNPELATLWLFVREFEPSRVDPELATVLRDVYLRRGAPREESRLLS